MPGPAEASERDGYFDLLRALALLRVVIYHTAAAYWLHVAFPAIGVMFALAGSLMARSLSRRGSLPVVGSRLRRLLPPVWVYGIVALAVGWETARPGEAWWSRLPFWLFPIRDPHSSAAESGFVDTLWYLRTYLWFVLLSPLLLWLFRRRPAVVLLVPLVLLPVVALAPGDNWPGRGLLTDLLAYGSCWLLGFADADGLLRRLPYWLWWVVVAVAGAGLTVVVLSPTSSGAGSIGYGLWSAGVVLLLLWWRPDVSWLARRWPWLHRAVTVINARAVTIYLWHDPAIVASAMLLAGVGLHLWPLAQLPLVLLLTAVAVLALGFVEDLAARRRPAFWFTSIHIGASRHRAAPGHHTASGHHAASDHHVAQGRSTVHRGVPPAGPAGPGYGKPLSDMRHRPASGFGSTDR